MEVDINEIIRADMAGKIIGSMSKEDINKILAASLDKTLKEVLSLWRVEEAIKKDVQKYLVEYLEKPEVQDRIRTETMRSAEELISGVIAVIISKSQDEIKSKYADFVGKVSYDSILTTVRKNREQNNKLIKAMEPDKP